MARVYLDTSFVSACVTTRDDPASIVRRETSVEWMQAHAPAHRLFISVEVVNELDRPSFPQRQAAMEFIAPIDILVLSEEVFGVASVLVTEQVMPAPVRGDALHVGACCVHRIDYLLSWNVRHLANPNKTRHLQSICARLGFVPPTIVTPDLLWGPSP